MTRTLWRRSIALTAATLAVAATATCTSRALADHRPATHHTTQSASADDSSECGKGGDGGRGGDSSDGTGQPGEPGKPATRECDRYSDLPDKPKGKLTVADRVKIVLVLINGGATEEQIAKKYDIPKEKVETWKQAYLKEDWAVLLNDD
ncbi:hypothetical protein ABZ471_14145 [Streptomyces sp. NPDC005728]|uniref:hypothetical protein n=1 Tax=Streptomyces sp. NPDC005728 TaxID=3157054 RepID=UPI0034052BFB